MTNLQPIGPTFLNDQSNTEFFIWTSIRNLLKRTDDKRYIVKAIDKTVVTTILTLRKVSKTHTQKENTLDFLFPKIIPYLLNSKNMRMALFSRDERLSDYRFLLDEGRHLIPSILSYIFFSKILSIDDHEGITVAQINFMLSQAPHFTCIDIDSTRMQDEPMQLDKHEQITKLRLAQSNISIANLRKLLTMSPNLQKLRFSSCDRGREGFGALIALGRLTLEKLIEIDFYQSDITTQDLRAVFAIAPELQKLDLTDCEDIEAGSLWTIAKEHLQKLTRLKLAYTNIDGGDLRVILASASQLERISFKSCQNIQPLDFKYLAEGSLEKLTQITLAETAIVWSDLKVIFKAAPQLKRINLIGCKNIELGDFKNIPQGSLPHLTEVYLAHTQINLDDLKALFDAAPQLQEVDVQGCLHILNDPRLLVLQRSMSGDKMKFILTREEVQIIFSTPEDSHVDRLHHILGLLTEISLKQKNVTITDVACVLKETPFLEKLDLSFCQKLNEGDLSGFEGLSAKHLRELNLRHSTITKDNLQALLDAIDHIEKIDLSLCHQINPGDLKDIKINTPKFTISEINLSQTQVTLADVKGIIKASHNCVTQISILLCENISQADASLLIKEFPKIKFVWTNRI